MGVLGDLRAVRKQAKEINRTWDPAAQMREGMARMAGMQRTLAAQQESAALAHRGVPAVGTVLSVVDTGSRINFVPLIDLTVLVEIGDRPAYPATSRVTLPAHGAGQAVPGARVVLSVDPEDGTKLLVCWGVPAGA